MIYLLSSFSAKKSPWTEEGSRAGREIERAGGNAHIRCRSEWTVSNISERHVEENKKMKAAAKIEREVCASSAQSWRQRRRRRRRRVSLIKNAAYTKERYRLVLGKLLIRYAAYEYLKSSRCVLVSLLLLLRKGLSDLGTKERRTGDKHGLKRQLRASDSGFAAVFCQCNLAPGERFLLPESKRKEGVGGFVSGSGLEITRDVPEIK